VNQPPIISLQAATTTVLSTAGLRTMTNFVASSSPGLGDETLQNVTFSVVARDPANFLAQPTLVNLTTLTFQVMPTAKGNVLVDVTATDDGVPQLAARATFTIAVTSVNVAPSFSIPARINTTRCTAAANCGRQYAAFATNISAGPVATESGQQVQFTAIVDAAAVGLFTQQPSIVPGSGDLLFTLAPNKDSYSIGPFSVVVSATDTGGTANGGTDTARKTFVLEVRPPIPAPSFVLGSDLSVAQTAGLVRVTSWVSSIARGGYSLAALRAWATVSDTSLFVAPPRLIFAYGATADLEFTPASNMTGTADEEERRSETRTRTKKRTRLPAKASPTTYWMTT
jgi:hypothetical protein